MELLFKIHRQVHLLIVRDYYLNSTRRLTVVCSPQNIFVSHVTVKIPIVEIIGEGIYRSL